MSNNAVINFNTDPKLKREATRTAKDMGLPLSIVMNNWLRKFVAEKRIEFIVPEIPNARLRKAIEDGRKEYASGKMKFYDTPEEMFKSLGI